VLAYSSRSESGPGAAGRSRPGSPLYTINVANPAGTPPTRLAPGNSEDHPVKQQPLPAGVSTFSAPSFYLTGSQPLHPGVVLLAIVVAAGALSIVLYALSHSGHVHFTSGANRSTSATAAADQKDDDDPNQIDTIVLGDPRDAPVPARPGDHVSSVHPTILVRLPRWGEQLGLIPNTPAGQLLYNWLAAYNQASYPALANALPNVALAAATAAQLQLRRQTGGFSLLSAKEVLPGVLVFRLRDQTPSATEVLGTLQVRQNSKPPAIASFSLRAVPSSCQEPTTMPAPLSAASRDETAIARHPDSPCLSRAHQQGK
jgi:hypothetical protein